MRELKKKKHEKAKASAPKWAVLLLFTLLVIQVVLANSLVTKGREINQFTAEREQLRAAIVSLENEVAQVSSLVVIRRKAKKLGMRPGKVEFLPPPSLASAP